MNDQAELDEVDREYERKRQPPPPKDAKVELMFLDRLSGGDAPFEVP